MKCKLYATTVLIAGGILMTLLQTPAVAQLGFDLGLSYARSWSEVPAAPPTSTNFPDQEIDNLFGFSSGIVFFIQKQFSCKLGFTYMYGIPENGKELWMYDASIQTVDGFFGLQFIPYIATMYEKRLSLMFSAEVGYAWGETTFSGPPSFPNNKDIRQEDSGPSFKLGTGLLIEASQHFTPFFLIGWERVFYMDKWKKSTNNIIFASFGVRFNMYHSRQLLDEY